MKKISDALAIFELFLAMPKISLKNTSVIIITGGSSGIGSSIIKALSKLVPAATICNLSRTKPDFFFNENQFIHIPADLSGSGSVASVAVQLNGILSKAEAGEVLLFNNSGFGDYGCFQDLDPSKQLNMIDLNIRAVVELTNCLLPQLLERGGCIVNIASVAGFQPTPYMATYGATKSFVLNWTLALGEDLRGTKVRTLAVCPGPTQSNFFKAAGFVTPPMGRGINKVFGMTSEEVATLTLRAVARGRSLLITGWKNKLVVLLGSKFPILFVTRISAFVLRKMRSEA